MPELATRPLLGYPDANITLLFEEGNIAVVITDHRAITRWEPRDRHQAKEMFFHPFVHGYEYPSHEYQGEDGA